MCKPHKNSRTVRLWDSITTIVQLVNAGTANYAPLTVQVYASYSRTPAHLYVSRSLPCPGAMGQRNRDGHVWTMFDSSKARTMTECVEIIVLQFVICRILEGCDGLDNCS
jgi:hypothetical protein